MTYDNVYQYLYDAEGRICAVENTAGPSPVMTGYLYDAEGNRIAKGTIQNMTSCDPAVNGFVASSEVDSIRDQNGQQMAEATINAGSGTMVSSHANVWAAGQLLATYAMNQTGTPLSFYFNDPLGTRRIKTTTGHDPPKLLQPALRGRRNLPADAHRAPIHPKGT